MPLTVTPETFTFVNYDHSTIPEIADKAATDAGLPGDADVQVEIQESTPLGRVHVDEYEPGPPARVRIRIEGGAFEHLKEPRALDPVRVAETLGRVFFRLADQLNPDFGFEGDPEELKVPRQVAWDVYALGRLNNLGYSVSHDRWLYLWRNRHGFTDESDIVFERLWSGQPMTWAEILGASEALKPDSAIQPTRRTPQRAR